MVVNLHTFTVKVLFTMIKYREISILTVENKKHNILFSGNYCFVGQESTAECRLP